MSIKAMSIVWESKLESSKRFILLYYADRGNDEGENVYPSVHTVAERTGLSRRTVQRLTKEMVEDGLMTLVGPTDYGTNSYKLHLEAIKNYLPNSKIEDPEEENIGEFDLVGGDTMTPPPCHSDTPPMTPCHPPHDTMTPKPLFNHKLNHELNQCAESTDAVENTSEELWEEIGRNSPFKKGDLLETVKLPPPKSGDELDGMVYFSNLSKGVDVSHYPEDIQPLLIEIFKFWKILPPGNEKDKGTRSQKALWIKEARALLRTFGEFGFKVLYEVFRDWNKEKRLTISRPGSLINLCTAKAGLMRQKYSTSLQPNTEQYDPEAVKLFQMKLKQSKNQPSQVEVDSPY